MNSDERAKVRLNNLVERGMLKREMGAASEVQGLLNSAKAFLADAKRRHNSEETRFNVACEAAHALALAAMRACDLRPGKGPGHRAIVFDVLDATTTAKASICVALSKAHDKRNKLAYDGLRTFSASELTELIKSVDALAAVVVDCISAKRPDLL
jgi:hypothetical protein